MFQQSQNCNLFPKDPREDQQQEQQQTQPCVDPVALAPRRATGKNGLLRDPDELM